jgi:hydrogenase maturation protein HypF
MIADEAGYQRLATFRAVPLAGGDQAVRQVWRIALALLDEAFDGEPPLDAIPLFRDIPRGSIDAMRHMIAGNVNAPLARGAGRYFDAIGAVALSMPDARHEGEVAFQLNMAADPEERGLYPVVIRDAVSPWELDLRPVMKAAVADLIAGRDAATISARFHNTLAVATVDIVRAALARAGDVPVVLGGGCFQNARLAEDIADPLRRGGASVYMNHAVPPGDGGLALGQAVIANAILLAGEQKNERKEEVFRCV